MRTLLLALTAPTAREYKKPAGKNPAGFAMAFADQTPPLLDGGRLIGG